MHTLKLSPFILSLLLGACGGSDSGTDTPASDTTDATAATTPPGTSTSGAATTGDATVTTGGATTHTHDSDHHDTSTDASTGHETGTTADTHADHGSTDHATSEAGTTAGGSLAEDYCLCMLDSCHDLYHGTWGEDHEQSEAMCMAAAEAVPSVGAPATSGNSIECRLHFCAMGHDVAGACEAAMGADPCVD